MRIHVCHPIIVAQLAYAEVLNSLICKAIALVIHGVQVQLPLVSFNPLLTMTLSLLQLPDLLFQFIFLPPQSNQFTLHGQNGHFKLYILPNQITPSSFQSRKVFSFIFLIYPPLSIDFCYFFFQS
jgi:hypothetical protein